MKKATKFLALSLAIVLVLGIFTSCSKDNKVSTGGTFTYWTGLDNNSSQTIMSYADLLMYQEMEKATGTKVEFIHPAQGSTGTEAFQILMASGDYPDMIEASWQSAYTGGAQQAIDDGVIIALNDYMEDYAPNYYNYLEGDAAKETNYMYKAATISDKGDYYGFRSLNFDTYAGFSGLYVRKDLLDKWGLDIPETIDDWTNVFKTAKENGIKYPLTGRDQLIDVGAWGVNMLNVAWKVGTTFYIDDDEVKFGPFEPAYKEYVAKMAEWMKAGYIDVDFVTNGNTEIQGNICNGISIAAPGFVGGDLGSIIPAMKERNPEFDLVACPFPVLKKGDTPYLQSVSAAAVDPTITISVQCGAQNEERYKEAISWCDYLYSDEGIILKSFGVEGDTYTVEKDEEGNEHYVYTDKVVKNYQDFGASNISAALYHFMLPANHPGFNQHPDYFEGYYDLQQQKDAIVTWNSGVDEARKHTFPSVTYTGEEAAEKANIESRGKDNFVAAIHNIVYGKASIDTYDDAVKDLKKAGYDKLLEINKAAYKRYLEKINN